MATDSSHRSNRCRDIAFNASIDSCPGNLFNALSHACSADLVYPVISNPYADRRVSAHLPSLTCMDCFQPLLESPSSLTLAFPPSNAS